MRPLARTLAALFLCVAGLVLGAAQAAGVEIVRYRPSGERGDKEIRKVVGEILVEAQDGGLMLRSDDGRIVTVQPKQIVERLSNDLPLEPLSADEMERRMLEEYPGFEVHRTNNYVILHDTDEIYVRRVAELFERLHHSFFAYWKNQRWKLEDPKFPLVAMVLDNRQDFVRHARKELGDTAQSVIGYYHLESNWMTTYRVPNLERNIATIIHEATHQLAYNSGMQQRFADNPMWVSEGLAMFFETPDFSNPRGWRGVGLPNPVNLRRWKNYQPRRPEESLATLISEDTRFRSPATAENAYAESWALTYFLIKTHREEYVQFLRKLSEGRPLAQKTKRERIDMFEEAFNADLVTIDRALVAYIRRLR